MLESDIVPFNTGLTSGFCNWEMVEEAAAAGSPLALKDPPHYSFPG